MNKILEWAINSAFKRTIIIIFLFLVSFYTAFLWPVQPEPYLPVIDGVVNEFEYPVFHRIGDIGLYIENDQNYGYFALTSPGSGWVAIGFSPADMHMGANFLMFAITENGTIASDQYGVSQFVHDSDVDLGGSFDIVEFAGIENDVTVVEFKFKLNSGDTYDTVLKMGVNYPIIVAYNMADDNFTVQHSKMYHHTIGILKAK